MTTMDDVAHLALTLPDVSEGKRAPARLVPAVAHDAQVRDHRVRLRNRGIRPRAR
ncbi:MAG: hypothetical protein QOF92_4270 [Pseudonocardiales bacterium]|nr:hypothetical protein [Pseudonocardiales bacterium]